MRLIDADALFDAMTSACNIFDAHGIDTTISRALMIIAEKAPSVYEWISVKDRLPEDGRDVLAYYNHPVESRIVPANYHNDVWFDCVFNRPIDIDIDYITHWMPLPEPPKEVTACD